MDLSKKSCTVTHPDNISHDNADTNEPVNILNSKEKVDNKHDITNKLVKVGYYNLEKTIGKGNFSVVKLATHTVTKIKVAIKIIQKHKLNAVIRKKVSREIEIMSKVNHPHILKLFQVMETARYIYLVTEYAPGGEIFEFLVANGRMSEDEACRIFHQILSAVLHCHSNNIVHRDIKAENLLLDEKNDIKLADFGFSNFAVPGQMLETWCGSPSYAAPEIFEGIRYDGTKSDIWSLGVILYVLVCGGLPFAGSTVREVKSRVSTGIFRIPFFMSSECENLIRHMLIVDPTKRFTLTQIINHKWMSLNKSGETPIVNLSSPCEVSIPNSTVIDQMIQLPDLSEMDILDAIRCHKLGHISAIYHMLCDKLEKNALNTQQPSMTRKASITTGVVERLQDCILFNVHTVSPEEQLVVEQFDDNFMETDSPSVSTKTESVVTTTRRHTVGPGNESHNHVLDTQCFNNYNQGLNQVPNTNLLYNLPLVVQHHPQNFAIKDQHLLKPPPVMGATNSSGFGRRASDGGANFQMSYQRVEGVYSQPGSQEDVINTREAGHCRQSQPIAGMNKISKEGDEEGSFSKSPLDQQPVQQSARTRRSGIQTVMDRPPVISPEVVREVEARMRRGLEYTPPACSYPVYPSVRHNRIKQVPSMLPPVKESRRTQSGTAHLKDVYNHFAPERFSPSRRITPLDHNGHTSCSNENPDASPIRNLQQEYQQLQKSNKCTQQADVLNNIHIVCSNTSRSPSSSPPVCTSPTISSGSCSPTLQKLQLTTGGYSSTSSSPTHSSSVTNCLSDKPLNLKVQQSSQTPSPTLLSIIQEEIPPGSNCAAVNLINPRISITDELGRISISEELIDIQSDMPLPPRPFEPLTLSLNSNQNVNMFQCRPSIVRGVGKCSTQQTYCDNPCEQFEIPIRAAIDIKDLFNLVQHLLSDTRIVMNQNVIAFPNGLQIELELISSNLRLRRISGDHSAYKNICTHLASTIPEYLCLLYYYLSE